MTHWHTRMTHMWHAYHIRTRVTNSTSHLNTTHSAIFGWLMKSYMTHWVIFSSWLAWHSSFFARNIQIFGPFYIRLTNKSSEERLIESYLVCDSRDMAHSIRVTYKYLAFFISTSHEENRLIEFVTLHSQSGLTYDWGMSHMWMSHVLYINEADWVGDSMPRIESREEWAVLHVWTSRVSMDESCRTYHQWVMSDE